MLEILEPARQRALDDLWEPAPAAPDPLAESLVESDSRYFEMAAEIEHTGGVTIAHMPGLVHIAAGCVAHRPGLSWDSDTTDAGIEVIECRLAELRCPQPRFYLTRPLSRLEQALAARGYRPRVELGLITRDLAPPERRDVRLRRVVDEDDWDLKVRLHTDCPMTPDGYATVPRDWVEMERRKCQDGGMMPYLIESGGVICGAVNAIAMGGLWRLKNLVVHPRFRRRGLAVAAVRLLAHEANMSGGHALGSFTLENDLGLRTYRRAGLAVITRQIEWSRPECSNP